MTYKYYTFKLFPYDAVSNIKCTSSNMIGPAIDYYRNQLEYKFRNKEIGIGMSYFITCESHVSEMTFDCSAVNGNLVKIDTNLDVSDVKKVKKSGYKAITSFKLSNKTIFNTNKEPYIYLYFNEVQIRTLLFTHSGSKEPMNRFPSLKVEKDTWTLGGVYKLPKYIKVSWTKEEKNTVVLSGRNVGWFHVRRSTYTKTGKVSKKIIIANNADSGKYSSNTTITVPALQNSNIVLYLIEYHFAWMGSEPEIYYSSNYRTVYDTYLTYSWEGFIRYERGRQFIETNNNLPKLYSIPYFGSEKCFYKLGKFDREEDDFIFYNDKDSHYISACDSTKYDFTWCEARENETGFMHYGVNYSSWKAQAKKNAIIYQNPYEGSADIGTLKKDSTATVYYSQTFKDKTYYYIETAALKGWVKSTDVKKK